MRNKEEPKTCRFCTNSTHCKRRQDKRFEKYGMNMYQATVEEDAKLDKKLAETCILDREEVYRG